MFDVGFFFKRNYGHVIRIERLETVINKISKVSAFIMFVFIMLYKMPAVASLVIYIKLCDLLLGYNHHKPTVRLQFILYSFIHSSFLPKDFHYWTTGAASHPAVSRNPHLDVGPASGWSTHAASLCMRSPHQASIVRAMYAASSG